MLIINKNQEVKNKIKKNIANLKLFTILHFIQRI